MANAQVEKIKELGLRHGEKLVVGLAATACVVLTVLALQKPTIALRPDEIKEAANAANQNINQKQDEKLVLEKIVADGLTDPGFVRIVEEKETQEANVDAVALAHPFTYPDPGAGLIRDAIDLIAPTDLLAHFGRGGIHVFATDTRGERKPLDLTKADPKKAASARSRMMAMGSGSGSGMGMPGMGMPGMGGAAGARQAAEAKKAAEREAERLRRRATPGNPNAPPPETETATPEALVQYEEETKGYRWAALVGVLDYKRLRDNYAKALKIELTSAYPNFVRLDIERQAHSRETEWTDWEPLDRAANQHVFDNLTEQDPDEGTPADVRLDPLVDILPYLRAGYYTGVEHDLLLGKERREQMAGPKVPPPGMMGMMGMPGAEMSSSSMGSGMEMMPPQSEMMGGSGEMMGMMGGGPMGGPEDTNFPKTEAETIMVRSLDFTVQPDTFYRYRLRIVVRNPNLNRPDVSPGVDNTSEELPGPWSEETDEVLVPPDVTIYALKKAPAIGQTPRDDGVEFEVARWNPEDGVTVVRSFPAAPGQLVGDPYSLQVPIDGEKPERKLIDFNSHYLVLDTAGGMRPIPVTGVGGASFDVPAVATVLRPDGTIVLHSQASDASDPEMKEIKEGYEPLKEAGQKRPPVMPGYEGMMPGMMQGSGGP